MEKNKTRLIDEALASEKVLNTLRLGREFIVLNQKFTMLGMGIFLILNILSMSPLFGFLFTVFAGVFGLALQIYVGRTLYNTKDIFSYIEEIKGSDINKSLGNYFAPAFGAYIGLIIFLLALTFIFVFFGASMGLLTENMTELDLINLIATLGIPLILIFLLISYVQPLVHAKIIFSTNFEEGFKSVFTIFSAKLWKSAWQASYFKYVAVLGTLVGGVVFVIGILLDTLVRLTGLTLIGNIGLVLLIYIFMIIMSIGSMMSQRLVEEEQ